MKHFFLLLLLFFLSSCSYFQPKEQDPNWRVTAYEIIDGAYNLECAYKFDEKTLVKFPKTPLRLNKAAETSGEVDGWKYKLDATAVVHEGALIVYYDVEMEKDGLVKEGQGAVFPR